jgi:hypothetical protein
MKHALVERQMPASLQKLVGAAQLFDGPPMHEIERLEAEIAELREAVARSRRLALAGRAAAIAGPALILASLLGLIGFAPARAIAAVALTVGGVVLMGSSRSSTEELERSLKRAEAEHAAAIDGHEFIDLGDAIG